MLFVSTGANPNQISEYHRRAQDVGDPELVRAVGLELVVHQVRCRPRVRVSHRRPEFPSATDAFERVEALFPPPLPLPPVLTTDGIHADRPNVSTERAALVAYLQVL
jgi:hypothetical protein